MAAGLIDVVVGRLGGMVLDQITNEASLFFNFRKDFEWLSEKLTNITSYLKDADVHSAHNQRVKRWLLRLADIAMDAEDILDECAVQSLYSNNSTQSSCVCPCNYSQLVLRYKMGRRIKDVKERMRTIMEDAAELKLVADLTHSEQPSTSTSQDVKWKRSSMIESGERPVAIESKVEDILRLLEDPAAPVIAVIGMGGVGKTFLLQNVFNRVKDRFDNSTWLAISQSYSRKQLQRDLAAKIRPADVDGTASEISKRLNDIVNGSVSETQAAELIHDRLESTKSLIVLDDVWRATGVDNLISALGLPTGNNTQSKILVSTRIRNVCRNMNARVYEMKLLSEEESWKLFCAFAFPVCEESRPPHHLHEIASQIEKECGRLPLAIKTVAASLEGKTATRDWESKLRQLEEVAKRDDPIMEILKLSYDSLPAPLKPCFAYLSFFPEDEEIDLQYLINLWIAEGFIHAGEDQVEIGRDYIYHLQNLCLLEIVEDYGFDQRDKCCRVHDLLLDLAISISKESRCAFCVGEAFSNVSTIERSSDCRRFFLAKKSIADGEIACSGACSASRLRTLSLSENSGIENIPANLFSGVRVLRVLDLSSTSISALPRCVADFKLLRVLNLSGTEIKEVPESVRSIKSLRVLNISGCSKVQQLPVWIGELHCLEYLDIRSCGDECARRIPKGVSMLVSLQALRSSYGLRLASNNEGDNELLKVEHLVNLVNLREVGIDVGDVEVLKGIEEGILAPLANMRNLRLGNRVETVNYDEESNLPPLSEKMLDMKDLEILYLDKFAVPRWICGFSNLMELELWRCHCADYAALQTMPNLISLQMWTNNKCRVLPKGFGKARGFLQLRYLQILYFSLLEELAELEDGAMPRLEILRVIACARVKKVPGGLELLKSLKECDFRGTGTDALKEELNKIKEKKPNVRIVWSTPSPPTSDDDEEE